MDTTPEIRRSWLQRLLGITHHVTSEEHLQELIHASEEGGIINAEEGEDVSVPSSNSVKPSSAR